MKAVQQNELRTQASAEGLTKFKLSRITARLEEIREQRRSHEQAIESAKQTILSSEQKLAPLALEQQMLEAQAAQVKRDEQDYKAYLLASESPAAASAGETSHKTTRKAPKLAVVSAAGDACPFKGKSERQRIFRIVFDEMYRTKQRMQLTEIVKLLQGHGITSFEGKSKNYLSRMFSSQRDVFCTSPLGWGLVAIHGPQKE